MRYADGREVTPSSAEEIEIWFHCPEAGAASPIAYELVPPASGSACPDIICRRHGRYLLRASVEPRPDGKGSYAEVDQERITTPQ
jgi:hypothetical protein